MELALSEHFIAGGADTGWDIGSLDIGETKTFNTDLKVSENIISDITGWSSLNITSEKIKSFNTPRNNILIYGIKEFKRNYIPIIGLHAIEDEIEIPIELYTSHFDELCKTLKTFGFETITFKDLLDHLDFGRALPEKPVIITSDDGFGDLYTNAFPVLKKYSYRMTVFLVTGYIEDSEEDRKVNSFDMDRPVPMRPMLIWPEIIEMHEYGCEFLSHSTNHIRLGIASDEEFLDELALSKNDIQSRLGDQVQFFAWPYDNNSSSKWPLLPEAGYRGAVRYWGGIEDLRNIDLNNIKRVEFNSYIDPRDYAGYLQLIDIVIENEAGQYLKEKGEVFTLSFSIKNNDSQDLYLSSIELEIPENMQLAGMEPGGDISQEPGLSDGTYMWVGESYEVKSGDRLDLGVRLKAIGPGESIIKFRVTTNGVYIEGSDIIVEVKEEDL